MAYEALDTLQQTLDKILKRDDDLITRRVKLRIISILDKVVVLQLNLKHFPQRETIREVANATLEIIEYIFSPENVSDCGSIEPTFRLTEQLVEVADKLDSTAGDVVDYCRKVQHLFSSEDFDEDPTAATKLSVGISDRMGILAVKIKSTAGGSVNTVQGMSDSLADGSSSSSSSRSAFMAKDVAVGRDNNLSDIPAAAISSSSRSAPTSKDVAVGFLEDSLQIMDWLTNSQSSLQILPIVGMGGIGKSTLAKFVYEEPLVKHRFDICAWVTISQNYSVESILLNLLASMKGKVDRVETKDVELDQRQEIHKYLMARRYVIVLDDMWSNEVWDVLRNVLPDDNNGSRIILTTRLRDVATYPDSSSTLHIMRFLDEEQSWHLFQQKVFGDQYCPLELEGVGKKIVKGCGGLPLSIVTMAGLLSKIGRIPKLWLQIGANDGQLETILSLSYNHLTQQLRACFLYMAGFPEDYDIRVSELIKLWVAEGFLESPNRSKSLEEVAEDVLEALVEQSIVLVTSKKIDGKIKSCRLHSMVRDFCVRQAGQEKFILPVMDYLPTPILRRHFLSEVLQNHPRISVDWYDLNLKDSMHSSCTRSIICIPQRGYRPKGSVKSFNLLRVLHVLRRNDHSYWDLGQVFDLVYLTYLASNIPSSIVPPAISKLQNLQTLIIYRSEVRLPVEIWRMRQLRHLIAFSFHPLPQPEGAAHPLDNLLTLSLATNFVCCVRMVETIPNIKKLGIYYSEGKSGVGYHLENLAHLLQLEKLKLETHSLSWLHLNPVFPPSLKKLELSGWRLPLSDMTVFGSLPYLQVLKLKNYACDGEHWETKEGEFENLRLLLIDESNLQQWITESSHFPRLEHLVLYRCPNLSEIPTDVGDIPTLELIEVDDHNHSLFDSAKAIQEEQWELGYDDLQVLVKRHP